MKSLRPITTLKLIRATSIDVLGSSDPVYVDLRGISQLNRCSIQYLIGGEGETLYSLTAGPFKTTGHSACASGTLCTSGGIQRSTLSRAVSSNVATIETVSEHSLNVGDLAMVRNMGDSRYNGVHIVTAVADTNHYSFALEHEDETETLDWNGSSLKVQTGSVSISLIAPVPWIKLTLSENDYGTVDYADVWVNIQ